MDTREAKVQLPSYLIGDLSPKEAAILEGHFDVDPEAKSAKESMSRQLLPVINLPAPEVSAAALDKLFVDARRELELPVYQPSTVWLDVRNIALRVAAVLFVGALLGWGIYGITPTSGVGGSIKLPTGVTSIFRYGDVIETSQGVPMTVEVKSTGANIAMDGSAAVKVTRVGKEVVVQILRGRAIVSAGYEEAQIVECGTSTITVDTRSVAAIDYDTPFRRINGNGAVVELQRQTINDVARDAERLYGGSIETTTLPEAVSKRRISLYGVGLRKEEFIAAFKGATERFGVTFKEDGKNCKLVYNAGTAGNTADESESVLKVAPLAGTLTYKDEDRTEILSERQANAAVVANNDFLRLAENEGAMKAQRMVVWAGRTDMPFFKLDQTVSNYISMGKNGGAVVVASALPSGTVITESGLRFKTGALIKVGEKITINLPGATGGTLLGVMSSGIEVAKGDDANTRYFVPVSASR